MTAASPAVVVTEFIEESALASLRRDHAVHYDPTLVDRPDEIVRLAAASPAIIVRNATQMRGTVLDRLKALRVIGRLGVGLDNIDMTACQARGIQVFPATGANTVSVAEYVIDEAALAAALKAGKLGFAVLDVFADESLKKGSPLVGAPNLIATPHVAGNTVESNLRVSSLTVDNVRRALKALA